MHVCNLCTCAICARVQSVHVCNLCTCAICAHVQSVHVCVCVQPSVLHVQPTVQPSDCVLHVRAYIT